MAVPLAFRRACAAAIVAPCIAGCSGGGPAPLECVANLDASCAPLYAPTFDNIYSRTLHPTCAQAGGACHASMGGMGGLVFEDADASYSLLLGQSGGKARVDPGDASCSLLIERLYATDPDQVMPKGGMLSAPERCAFVQWIRDGAKR